MENRPDWCISRQRTWGVPIAFFVHKETGELHPRTEELIEEVAQRIEKAGVDAWFELEAAELLGSDADHYDKMSDTLDVWFDSGSMPYAQWHYPFENKDLIDAHHSFPADFIAEGVDQTRGWFYTLHAIATMVFDSVAYKAVVSNGLVLDKNGQKMSKRLGNAIDPFSTLEKYGPDATRWYMITNAQPWDNLKFDLEGITEVQRKFFGTLYNTYSFFALYANIDKFDGKAQQVPVNERPEIDRWVLSKVNSLIAEVESAYEEYEPTKAGRLIQEFVTDQLSNWYVRLCRRRFWKSDDAHDKLAAYQTLYTCLETVSILGAPIAPFFMDRLFCDLNSVTGNFSYTSVHLVAYPSVDKTIINDDLEIQMNIAQGISSLVLGLRKKEKMRVRQPLQKIMVPVLNKSFADNMLHVKELILSEVNVKELELLSENNDMLVKSIKPNFKTIGPKYGKQMKAIAALVAGFTQDDIASIESTNAWSGEIDGTEINLDGGDFDIIAQDIPGWLVSSENGITVALDITLTEELRQEGIARELINRVQNLRKDSGLEVTDKINLFVECSPELQTAIQKNGEYVCNEVLANNIQFETLGTDSLIIDLVEEGDAKIALKKA
jgi:isoleucyl-tRNA synthetase